MLTELGVELGALSAGFLPMVLQHIAPTPNTATTTINAISHPDILFFPPFAASLFCFISTTPFHNFKSSLTDG
jgi:hypothetical protein